MGTTVISPVLIGVAITIRLVVLVLLVPPIYRRYVQVRYERYQASVMAIGIFLIFWVNNLLQLVILVVNPSDVSLGKLDVYNGIVVGLMTYFFVESYASTHVNIFKVGIAASLASVTAMLGVIGSQPKLVQVIDELMSFNSLLILNLVASLYFVYILVSIWSTLRRIKPYVTEQHRRSIESIQLYVLIVFGMGTVAITSAYVRFIRPDGTYILTNASFVSFSIVPAIVLTTGIYVFYHGYFRHGKPYMIQPQRVDRLMVISDGGLTLYDKDMTHISTLNDMLFSGGIMTFRTIMEEATNISGTIKSIQIGDMHMMFKCDQHFFIMMFTRHPTRFLEEGLEQMKRKMKEKGIKLEYSRGYSVEDEIGKIVNTVFGL